MTPEQIDALIAERDAAKVALEQARARADGLQETLDRERAARPALVAEAVALREDARIPITDEELITALISKAGPGFRIDGIDGRSADYLRGRLGV